MNDHNNAENGIINSGSIVGNVVAGRNNRQTVSGPVDASLVPLAEELKRLLQAVTAAGPDHADDAEVIREAVHFGETGDRSKLQTALMSMSSWVLSMAQMIGVKLVANELGKLV